MRPPRITKPAHLAAVLRLAALRLAPLRRAALRLAPALVLLLLSLLLASTGALAQEEMAGLPQATDLARQSLRPYWHVFAAYAIAIVLIGGWAVSIARRLADVEDRLLD